MSPNSSVAMAAIICLLLVFSAVEVGEDLISSGPKEVLREGVK